MNRVAPGARPDVFAADAWTASKAFLDSVENLAGPITRAGVVAELGSSPSTTRVGSQAASTSRTNAATAA